MHAYAFREMDYSKRHCWPLNDGRYRIDGRYDDSLPSFCNDWQKHVEKAGPTEFLRWIRNFGVLAPGIVTGFDDGWLKLGTDWSDTYRMDMYCENYGGKIKCFLDTEHGVAVVEVYDSTLLDAVEQATIQTNQEYEDMIHVESRPA